MARPSKPLLFVCGMALVSSCGMLIEFGLDLRLAHPNAAVVSIAVPMAMLAFLPWAISRVRSKWKG